MPMNISAAAHTTPWGRKSMSWAGFRTWWAGRGSRSVHWTHPNSQNPPPTEKLCSMRSVSHSCMASSLPAGNGWDFRSYQGRTEIDRSDQELWVQAVSSHSPPGHPQPKTRTRALSGPGRYLAEQVQFGCGCDFNTVTLSCFSDPPPAPHQPHTGETRSDKDSRRTSPSSKALPVSLVHTVGHNFTSLMRPNSSYSASCHLMLYVVRFNVNHHLQTGAGART